MNKEMDLISLHPLIADVVIINPIENMYIRVENQKEKIKEWIK